MATNQTQLIPKPSKQPTSLFTLLDNHPQRRANSETKNPKKTLPAPRNKRVKQNLQPKPNSKPTLNPFVQKPNPTNQDPVQTLKPKSTKIQKDPKKPLCLTEITQRFAQKNDYADFLKLRQDAERATEARDLKLTNGIKKIFNF
jgi:hypothetical protein